MNFLISKTYATSTPESVEHGDFEDTGFEYEAESLDFRELVRELECHPQASESHCVGPRTWFSSGFETEDYRTGEEKETSVHFDRENPPQAEKYWKWAAKIAAKRNRF